MALAQRLDPKAWMSFRLLAYIKLDLKLFVDKLRCWLLWVGLGFISKVLNSACTIPSVRGNRDERSIKSATLFF